MKRLLLIIAAVGCLNAPAAAGGAESAAQCRHADRFIQREVRFARGRTTAVFKGTVRPCTSHVYALPARAGQTMIVNLAAGNRTSFTVSGPSVGLLEGADGVKRWSGELPEDGDYTIQIGTDATAAYTLEVTIR